ncbi:hypothetical protein LXT21_19565 [Myxococcus sp. K38C18041901]|uniref:hypothetical protein n=1 Tax=Myxococcus guangdongensis TaxID=2906760 RepID=UPI0020A70A9F|nr:hypothetical protein [Myxococcus guangdongensis]MCP3060986.1 hypothetical protein [Myxococcus guangdongensis]
MEKRSPREQSDRPTDRVGPYHLGRCIERGTQHGDLYLARHVKSGEAAYLARPILEEAMLLPTTPLEVVDQFPSATVEVAFQCSDSPAYRAMVVRPARGALPARLNEELTAVSEELPKMMEHAMSRADVREHLLSPRVTAAQRWKGRIRRQAAQARRVAVLRWKDAALVVAVAGFLGVLLQRSPRAEPESVPMAAPSGQQELATSLAEAAIEELVPAVPFFENAGAIARDMPGAAFEGQKKPPCTGEHEELVGGCWVAIKKAPPCGDSYYEKGDTCYAPVWVVKVDGKKKPPAPAP